MAGRFLGLLGLLGAKYSMDEDSEHVVNQKELEEAIKAQDAKYKLSPAAIHRNRRKYESEEDRKLREKVEALSKK